MKVLLFLLPGCVAWTAIGRSAPRSRAARVPPCTFESFPTTLLQAQETKEAGSIPPTYYPALGDIVSFPGAYGDLAVGRLAFIQYIKSRGEWIGDVVLMKETGDNYYSEIKNRRVSETRPLSELRPMRANFVRSTNGWKISSDKEGNLLAFADGYVIDDSFQLPKPVVNETKMTESLEDYEELKTRLLREAALFGTVASVAVAVTLGVRDAGIFLGGVLGGSTYLLLLERRVDRIGSDSSDLIAASRFLIPPALVAIVAIVNAQTGFRSAELFNTLPKDEFLCAVLGFLSYRVPLVYRELKEAVSASGDVLLDVLPGSLAKSVEIATKMQQSRDGGGNPGDDGLTAPEVSILLISGPRGSGRPQLTQRFMESTQGKTARPCTTVTTVGAQSEAMKSQQLSYLDPMGFDEVARKGDFLTYDEADEAEDNAFRAKQRTGLLLEDVKSVGRDGKVCVVELEPRKAQQFAEAVDLRGDMKLTGVWVSLANLDDIEQGLRDEAGDDVIPSEIENQLKQVVSDIEWGVLGGYFDFTILNENGDKSMDDLCNKALAYASR